MNKTILLTAGLLLLGSLIGVAIYVKRAATAAAAAPAAAA